MSTSVPRARTARGAAALLAVTLLPLLAPAAAAQELTVQERWRLLVVGLDVGPALRRPRSLLARLERGLRRELPGLEVTVDRARWRDFAGPPGVATLGDDALAQVAVTACDQAGFDPASYDVVFVLSPHWKEPAFGYSHLEARDRAGRAVRVGWAHTAPGRTLLEGLARGLAGDDTRRGEVLARLGSRLGAPFDRGLMLEVILLPTLAHELGHFFAPGDLDIRDGYQAEWLQHATSDDDNPHGHGLDCVMYKGGRDAAFYVRKLLVIRGRLVRFCDACRTRLGCRR